MAKLTAFKVDSAARENGEWVTLDDYDGLKIKTRGFTDQYVDARAQRMRRAAQPFGGDLAKVPNGVAREILVDCLVSYCLQDVAELQDAEGKPIDFAGFCNLLRDPDYTDLLDAAQVAPRQVGRAKAAAVQDAVGN